MLTLYYGADAKKEIEAGIKSHLEAGENVLLLVPEQETVVTERRLLDVLPPAAQLSFEVVNFTRLANRIFRTVGGLSYRHATPAVSALLMWRTLRSLMPELCQYGKEAGNEQLLVSPMLAAVKQCRAYAVSPEALSRAGESLPKDDAFRPKLLDLGLIAAAYSAELHQNYEDVTEDVSRATDLLLSNEGLFVNTHVYVQSFTDFTAEELKFLGALLRRAASLTVALPLANRHDNGIHLASATATARRLVRLSKECDVPVFYRESEAKKPQTALQYLQRDLFHMNAEPLPLGLQDTEDVHLTVASTPYAEAEYVATSIRKLLETGCRYRDVTVIVRDLTSYTGILDAALEKEGIPFYVSEKTDITLRPLIKLILFALRILQYGWQKEDVVGLLKTGLCGVSPDDVNFFEEYVEVWRPRGEAVYATPFTMNPDGYTDKISERGKRILSGANRAREGISPALLTLSAALKEAENTTALCRALFAFLEAFGVPSTLKEQATERLRAGERREAEELSRLYGVLIDALETLSRTMGEETLTLAELTSALSLAFTHTDMGAIPTSADEVMVGAADTLRAEPTPYVFVLGLNEGLFPQTVSDNGILSDAEKRRLLSLGIELSADNATRASDELFYLHRAVSLPTKTLYLSYTQSAADGRALQPSIGIWRLKRLLHGKREVYFDTLPALDKIYSTEGALEHLRDLDGTEREAVFACLAGEETLLKKARNLLSPVTDTVAEIEAARAERLFGPHAFNPTGLEQFSACKFAYYCRKILRLREEPTDTLDTAAVGTFVHRVLESAFLYVKRKGLSFAECGEAQTAEIVNASVATYREELRAQGGTVTPRAEALLTRLTSLMHIVLAALFEELADSDFTPAFFELNLKEGGNSPAVKLKNGMEIPLSGQADRVDVYTDKTGNTYLRIADYKTGKKTFSWEDMRKGQGLQMPLYLFALCEGGERLTKELGLPPDTTFLPAGFTYFSTAVGAENTPARVPFETGVANARLRLQQSGVLPDNEGLLHAISHSGSSAVIGTGKSRRQERLSPEGFEGLFRDLGETVGRIAGEMKSGRADIAPREDKQSSPCQYCAFGAVCRAAEKHTH